MDLTRIALEASLSHFAHLKSMTGARERERERDAQGFNYDPTGLQYLSRKTEKD